MTQIQRNTSVFSISLPKGIAAYVDKSRQAKGLSRSAFFVSLVEKKREDERWERIYEEGRKIGKKMGITSEDDIDRILHETS